MGVYACGQERPLGLFEVLARNRQSAVGLSGCSIGSREQPNRVFTIPPRQRLSITIWLAIRRRRVTQFIKTQKQTKLLVRTELEREREKDCERIDTHIRAFPLLLFKIQSSSCLCVKFKIFLICFSPVIIHHQRALTSEEREREREQTR